MMLSWQECVGIAFAATVLICGVVLTVLEMQRLGKEGQ
jgi:hypothetical protein